MNKLIATFTIFFIPGLLFAEVVTDLNGFRLLQYMSAAKTAYGDPDQSIENNGINNNVFYLSDEAYMVIGNLSDKKHNIYSLQITGNARDMIPFKGLILGDSVDKVNKILGNPSSVSKLVEPKVEVYRYKNTNYSVEIDENGKLYSIRIHITNELFDNAKLSDKHWDNFKQAILKKDTETILSWLRPDAEIYKNGETISINKKISEFNTNPDLKFINALLADKDSVYAELTKTEPDGEMRLSENMGVGSVFKFYKGSILREIVFFPYDGKYRIYEIAFVNNKN